MTLYCKNGKPVDSDGDIICELEHITAGDKSNFESRWRKGLRIAAPIAIPVVGRAIQLGALDSAAIQSAQGLGALVKLPGKVIKNSSVLTGSAAKYAAKTIYKTGAFTGKTLKKTGALTGKALCKTAVVAGQVANSSVGVLKTGFTVWSVVSALSIASAIVR